MIVVDTSAIFAIINAEPGHQLFVTLLMRQDGAVISAANVLELEMAVSRLRLRMPVPSIDQLLQDLGLDIAAFDLAQLVLAREAFLRFGKGRHPAGLNFGDCFAYALAKSLSLPLLFKGDDFSRTDVVAAVLPDQS